MIKYPPTTTEKDAKLWEEAVKKNPWPKIVPKKYRK